MHFTGSQATNIEKTLLEVLQAFLEEKFAEEPHLSTFAKWSPPGGIGVQISHGERDSASTLSSKRPLIQLSAPDGDHQREVWRTNDAGEFKRGTRHFIEIVLELYCSDAALAALQPLRDALADIFDLNQYALRTLGVEEVEFSPDAKRQANGNFIEPHTIKFVAYTLPS